MTQEETIEGMRYELGKEAAQKGEPLHEDSSEEFYHGYADAKPTAWRGSSNVTPRLFGKGAQHNEEWTCLCGYVNPRYIRKKCWQCGVPKSSVDEANEI